MLQHGERKSTTWRRMSLTARPSRKPSQVMAAMPCVPSRAVPRLVGLECSGQRRTPSRGSPRPAIWRTRFCSRSAISAQPAPWPTQTARPRRSWRKPPPLRPSRPRLRNTTVRRATRIGSLGGPGARRRGAVRIASGDALRVTSITIATPPTSLGRPSGLRTKRLGVARTPDVDALRRSQRS